MSLLFTPKPARMVAYSFTLKPVSYLRKLAANPATDRKLPGSPFKPSDMLKVVDYVERSFQSPVRREYWTPIDIDCYEDHHARAPVPNPKKRKRNDISQINPKKARICDENIQEEELDLTNNKTIDDKCAVCLDRQKEQAFLHDEFAHFCVCTICALRITENNMKCPICNVFAYKLIKIR